MPNTAKFSPFADESSVLELSTGTRQDASLTIENRVDAIEIYGSIRIRPDTAGRAAAVALRDLMDAVITCIDAGVPMEAPQASIDTVSNPFE